MAITRSGRSQDNLAAQRAEAARRAEEARRAAEARRQALEARRQAEQSRQAQQAQRQQQTQRAQQQQIVAPRSTESLQLSNQLHKTLDANTRHQPNPYTSAGVGGTTQTLPHQHRTTSPGVGSQRPTGYVPSTREERRATRKNILSQARETIKNVGQELSTQAKDAIQQGAQTALAHNPQLPPSTQAEQNASPQIPHVPGGQAVEVLLDQLEGLPIKPSELNAVIDKANAAIDPSQSPAQRLEAGLGVVEDLKDLLPADKLKDLPDMVQNISEGLPAAKEFAGMVNTLSDADASALDKAKAVTDFAREASDLLPEGSARRKLLDAAGKFGAPIDSIDNALKLFDPKLSAKEKVEAFVGLATGLGDSIESIKDIGKALDSFGLADKLGLKEGSTLRKAFDDVAGALDKVAGKLGAKAGKELFEKAGKALGKVLPALGGVVSGLDAIEMGKIATDSSLPPEIRFFAGAGAALNVADSGLAIAEAFGVGNIGALANAGLSIGEFALDVAVDKMVTDHKNGDFHASDEMHAIIGGMSVATAPTGLSHLANTFGLSGAIDVMKDTIKVGGQYVREAGEALLDFAKDKGEEAIRDAAEFVQDLPGDLKDGLGDLVGNFGDLLGDVGGFISDHVPFI